MVVNLFGLLKKDVKVECSHNWEVRGWTYLECNKCGKIKQNENLCSKYWEQKINRMYADTPDWITKEHSDKLKSKGITFRPNK